MAKGQIDSNAHDDLMAMEGEYRWLHKLLADVRDLEKKLDEKERGDI